MYLRTYEALFKSMVDEPVRLLELGIDKGGSLRMWSEYFPHGLIVGLDRKPVAVEDQSGRIRTFQGLQQDTALLDRIAEEVAPEGFDAIIDDASHIGEYTRTSFWHLFLNHLKPGGVYVIEDYGTGYWPSYPDGREYERPPSDPGETTLQTRFPSHDYGLVGFVKQLVDECALGRTFLDDTHPDYGKLKIEKLTVMPLGTQVIIHKKESFEEYDE
jgi:hypothetical protein